VPGPFSLADAGRLASLLEAAGFGDVAVEEQSVPLRAASFDEWWTRTSPIAVTPYVTADGLDLPGLALVASARRGPDLI
jgi:hypothetical protein